MTTDAEGQHEFKALPMGRYNIIASRARTGNVYGQASSAIVARGLDLAAGETLDRVDFTLTRGGVITGRIVDEFGEPLPGLQVSAMRAQMVAGKRQLIGRRRNDQRHR